MKYIDEITKAMKILAENEKTIILGQSVKWKGTGLFWTLEGSFPMERRIELPIFEDVQMGMCIGMALEGFIPVSMYPRLDFLILALNQMINHLDKIEKMSDGQFKPKVIIRSAIGSVKPLFPGFQHNQDHSQAIKKMCTNIDVVVLKKPSQIVKAYKKALVSERSTLLIEIPDLYLMEEE